jgi:hypothetical protein
VLTSNVDRVVLKLLKWARTQEQADRVLSALIKKFTTDYAYSAAEAEDIVRKNIGYLGGYCDDETRARIERLFRVEHPFFGSIEKNGPPSPEQAFAMGYALGERMRRDKEGEG